MKFILLAAGKSNFNNLPHSLVKYDDENTILDYQLSKIDYLAENVIFVGGYKLLDIMSKYQNLQYIYNSQWSKTKTLYSLSLIGNIEDDITISYGDTIFKKDLIPQLVRIKKDIVIGIDSFWKNRYEGRDIQSAEVVIFENNSYRFEKFNNQENIIGEFTGLIKISKRYASNLEQYISQATKEKNKDGLIDLLNVLTNNNKNFEIIDLQGNWSELDSIQDVEHFKFGTKAETLNNLKSKIKKALILEQISFTVGDYTKDMDKIISEIQSKIDSKYLVVRSSALNEDTQSSSMAGNYESILRVDNESKEEVKDAIEIVIHSYTKNDQEQNMDNQILVQPFLEEVTMSGVVFSKNLQTSSPYYIVNYDESSDTESVTSGNGKELNTFICYNDFENSIKNEKLSALINSVKEIEQITKYDAIDIEFAFTSNQLYILQVRPIAAKKDNVIVDNLILENELRLIKKAYSHIKPNLLGSKKAYGIMPDWNPAEIVGINPKTLAFDLYRYIITDNIWSRSRSQIGYRDVKSMGLVSFSGKPYVDIQMSFNSFIPKSIEDDLAGKLVDFFIYKLEKNPQFHDKVEFKVAITAYDFSFAEKEKELKEYGFSDDEIITIREAYKELTENIILEKDIELDEELEKTKRLSKKREDILNSNLDNVNKIFFLLEDCKEYGTLPFANLARFGFIGSIFLKSLLEKEIVSKSEYDNFFQAIHTIAKEFLEDFNLLILKEITKEEFLSKYGHLRPGTYDITSLSYQEGFDDYIDSNAKVNKSKSYKFDFSDEILNEISKEISNHNLSFNVEQLLTFIIKATEAREKAKFEFTKSLSAVLDLIEELGGEYGIDKDKLSYLNLDEILKYKNTTCRVNFEKHIKQNILINKDKYLITSAILLPELILSEQDIEMFFYPSSKPNFVSQHKIDSEIIFLKDNNQSSIDNKIVLIENADPGFDWIFSHNIKGLVTKYGGAASHMAIRCAEFDLPAAIGCGDKIFNDLVNYKKITLDCINQKIEGIY